MNKEKLKVLLKDLKERGDVNDLIISATIQELLEAILADEPYNNPKDFNYVQHTISRLRKNKRRIKNIRKRMG
jgi:hypothetical protein